MRRTAVFAALLVLGALLTSAAFTWLDVARSDAALVGLAALLALGNFAVLRRALDGARAPRPAPIARSERRPAAVPTGR